MTQTLEQSSFDLQFSSQDWAPVRQLIEEVQEQEKQEQFAATLFQWDLVVRFFRRVEKTHMLDREPTQQDLQYHKAFLNALLSVGEFLAISAEKFSNEDLKPFRIGKEDLLAYLRELEHSYSEWHGELSDARRQDLSQKIFGGAS